MWLGTRVLALRLIVWVMSRGQRGDKGLTDSKDRPGVGQGKGHVTTEAALFTAFYRLLGQQPSIVGDHFHNSVSVWGRERERSSVLWAEFVQSFGDVAKRCCCVLETEMWCLEIAQRRLALLFAFPKVWFDILIATWRNKILWGSSNWSQCWTKRAMFSGPGYLWRAYIYCRSFVFLFQTFFLPEVGDKNRVKNDWGGGCQDRKLKMWGEKGETNWKITASYAPLQWNSPARPSNPTFSFPISSLPTLQCTPPSYSVSVRPPAAAGSPGR